MSRCTTIIFTTTVIIITGSTVDVGDTDKMTKNHDGWCQVVECRDVFAALPYETRLCRQNLTNRNQMKKNDVCF